MHGSATALEATSHETKTTQGDSSREKIETLADIICGCGDQAAAALFVLMGTLQDSEEPEALAHTIKHVAFTRCGEFNVFGIVDAQVAVVEDELLAKHTRVS
jgi:hypothetical protein